MTKMYFLGPEGSNTHLAAEKFKNKLEADVQLISVNNIQQGFSIYSQEQSSAFLILPMENSIEGTVRETIDNLINNNDEKLKIFGEITLDIEHCLIANENAQINTIDTVISHHQAIQQCKDTLYELFGYNISLITTTSTSEATKSLTQYENNIASIANPLCAKIYGKKILKTNISKVANNKTRFALITKFGENPLTAVPSKTAIAFSTKNIAGALASVLDVLAYYGINLSHIDSRPSKIKLGEYVFYCELDTTFENNNLEIALNKIKNYTNFLKLCGEFFSI